MTEQLPTKEKCTCAVGNGARGSHAHWCPATGNPVYSCEACTAQCTFEAMQMCQLPNDRCPVLLKLASGEITDKRMTDRDPTFPSEFTYV